MTREFRADKQPPPRKLIPSLPSRIDLEIGCGVGWHSVSYAEKHPERYLVAIERTRGKFDRFQKRFEISGSPINLLPVHDDAEVWCAYYLIPGMVQRCFLLYPNPEPKRANQRWGNKPFGDFIIQCLAEGGEIFFATNLAHYAQEMRNTWGKHPELRLVEDRVLGAADEPRTHFEKKYLERGETCFNLIFIKQPV